MKKKIQRNSPFPRKIPGCVTEIIFTNHLPIHIGNVKVALDQLFCFHSRQYCCVTSTRISCIAGWEGQARSDDQTLASHFFLFSLVSKTSNFERYGMPFWFDQFSSLFFKDHKIPNSGGSRVFSSGVFYGSADLLSVF